MLKQRGFSLSELMIASLISLLVIGLVEWIALRRLPFARRWLGLKPA